MEQSPKPFVNNDLPPGTVRIQDVENSRTILVPQPSLDPNQPLVSNERPQSQAKLTAIELEHATESAADEHPLRIHDSHVCHVCRPLIFVILSSSLF